MESVAATSVASDDLPRWCAECRRWRDVRDVIGTECWLCDGELGEQLTVGAAVKCSQDRYARGEYGPRPVIWFGGHVERVVRQRSGEWCVYVRTSRQGVVITWTGAVLPMGASRGRG